MLVDQERILVTAVRRPSVLDDAQPPRRDLIDDPIVECDHAVRDVLLEPVTRHRPFAALAGDQRGHPSIFQPAKQAPELGTEQRFVFEAGEQRFEGVDDDALGSDRVDREREPYEQTLEVVLAGLLDLAALDAYEIDRQEFLRDEVGEIEPERADVTDELALRLLERDEHAGLALLGAVDQELECEERLAAPGSAADEARAAARESAPCDLIEAVDSGRCLGDRSRAFTTCFHQKPSGVTGIESLAEKQSACRRE